MPRIETGWDPETGKVFVLGLDEPCRRVNGVWTTGPSAIPSPFELMEKFEDIQDRNRESSIIQEARAFLASRPQPLTGTPSAPPQAQELPVPDLPTRKPPVGSTGTPHPPGPSSLATWHSARPEDRLSLPELVRQLPEIMSANVLEVSESQRLFEESLELARRRRQAHQKRQKEAQMSQELDNQPGEDLDSSLQAKLDLEPRRPSLRRYSLKNKPPPDPKTGLSEKDLNGYGRLAMRHSLKHRPNVCNQAAAEGTFWQYMQLIGEEAEDYDQVMEKQGVHDPEVRRELVMADYILLPDMPEPEDVGDAPQAAGSDIAEPSGGKGSPPKSPVEPRVSWDPETGDISVLDGAFAARRSGGVWRRGVPSADEFMNDFEAIQDSKEASSLVQEAKRYLEHQAYSTAGLIPMASSDVLRRMICEADEAMGLHKPNTPATNSPKPKPPNGSTDTPPPTGSESSASSQHQWSKDLEAEHWRNAMTYIDSLRVTKGPWKVDVHDLFGDGDEEDDFWTEGQYDCLEDALPRAIGITRKSLLVCKTIDDWRGDGEVGLVYDANGSLIFRAGEEYRDDPAIFPLAPATVLSRGPERDDAIILAAQAHKGQVDKAGVPYITHPLRVMLRLREPVDRIVAVLHDVVEDTAVTLDDLRKAGYSQAVLAAVECLTKREDEPYEAFIERCAANPVARRVKLADLGDNMDLSRLPVIGPKDRRRMARYEKARARLMQVGR